LICPSHGVIWRDHPLQIVKKYQEWASDYRENQITVMYETMYNGTRAIAEKMVTGITQADPMVNVKLFNVAINDKNDIITEIFKSKGILMGSPTVNNGLMSSTAGLLEMIKGLRFRNKKAAAFGCYGWHNVSVPALENMLKESGFDMVPGTVSSQWEPGEDVLEAGVEFGSRFAGSF